MPNTTRGLWAVPFLGLALAACGGDSTATTPTPPEPSPTISVSITPSTANLGAAGTSSFTATVSNATDSAVNWSTTGGTLAIDGNTAEFTAPGLGGSYTVTATSVENPSKSASATISVTSVAISVNPLTATLQRGGTTQFAATITGTESTGVAWSTTCGTITPNGMTADYVAPLESVDCTVTATSMVDGTKSASATVTVTTIGVSVSPASATLFRGGSATFTATVMGAQSPDVIWAATCGTLNPSGTTTDYVAPADPMECTITATSVEDPTAGFDALVSVRGGLLVNASDDTDDGQCTLSHCSLREAMVAVRLNPALDTIFLGTPPAPGGGQQAASDIVIGLTSALPVVTSDISLIGQGSGSVVIDAGGSTISPRRVLTLTGDLDAHLSGFTLRGGVTNEPGGGLLAAGGARVTASDLRVSGNEARGGIGGGVAVLDANTTLDLANSVVENNRTLNGFDGGGIAAGQGSSLTVSGTRVSGNMATGAGGGGLHGQTSGTLDFDGLTITGNTAGTDGGGFRFTPGVDVTLRNSTVTNNLADEGSGGSIGADSFLMENTAVDNNATPTRGGGLYGWGNAIATINGGSISGNSTTGTDGGGIYLEGLAVFTVTGTTLDGNSAPGAGGGFGLFGDARLTMDNVQLTNNTASYGGGGSVYASNFSFVTITNSTLTGNRATEFGGGALFGSSGVSLTLENSVLANNQAETQGGAVRTVDFVRFVALETEFSNNVSGGAGGGLRLTGTESTLDRVSIVGNTSGTNGGGVSAVGNTTISNSTVAGNQTTGSGGGISAISDGVAISNVTLSGNAAANGGGVSSFGATTIYNSTFIGNSASDKGPAVFSITGSTVSMANDVLAMNQGSGGTPGNCGDDGAGVISTLGGNVTDDTSCSTFTAPSDKTNVVPGINPTLADNGGPTLTHAVLAGSPAIGGAFPTYCPATDQRGFGRVSFCDSGAFEFGASAGSAGQGARRQDR